MKTLAALAAGLVFGFGLLVSGMANPAKVLGFLDLAGAWDPSLMFVMGGAIGVGAVAFAVARRRRAALLGGDVMLPTARRIDAPLLAGSAIFGLGWGIAGFCPGPALVALGSGRAGAAWFVLAMLVGFAAVDAWQRRGLRPQQRAA